MRMRVSTSRLEDSVFCALTSQVFSSCPRLNHCIHRHLVAPRTSLPLCVRTFSRPLKPVSPWIGGTRSRSCSPPPNHQGIHHRKDTSGNQVNVKSSRGLQDLRLLEDPSVGRLGKLNSLACLAGLRRHMDVCVCGGTRMLEHVNNHHGLHYPNLYLLFRQSPAGTLRSARTLHQQRQAPLIVSASASMLRTVI